MSVLLGHDGSVMIPTDDQWRMIMEIRHEIMKQYQPPKSLRTKHGMKRRPNKRKKQAIRRKLALQATASKFTVNAKL